MRNCRFFIILLIVCLLLPVFSGCAGNGGTVGTDPLSDSSAEATTTVAETEAPPPVFSEHLVSENREYVKLIGKSQYAKGAVLIDWTASGIEFEYEGSGNLELVLEKDAAKNIVLVCDVDGKTKTVTVDRDGTATYRIASDLSEGVHHVLIRRRTMVEDQAVGLLLQIKSIKMCGTFLPKPADKTYRVAFVGDSITCGVGIDKSPNGLATYAVDLSTREGFDYDICAISGIGVQHSTKKHKYTENNMTKYYPYFNYYRSETLRYLPERKADLVIVNLNTNDHNNGVQETPYKQALKTLISEIRAVHGENVNIVWVVGMMISKSAPVNGWLTDVFDELGGERAGLYRLEVDTNTEGESAHPSLSSHLAVSEALGKFIRLKGLLDLPALSAE